MEARCGRAMPQGCFGLDRVAAALPCGIGPHLAHGCSGTLWLRLPVCTGPIRFGLKAGVLQNGFRPGRRAIVVKRIVFVLALVFCAIGITGVVEPRFLEAIVRTGVTQQVFLMLAIVRLVFGAAVLAAAAQSRMPVTMRFTGYGVVIVGVARAIVAFAAMDQARGIIDAWVNSSDAMHRLTSCVVAAITGFIAYCFAPRGRENRSSWGR
jgi:hypothetical protein